MREVSVIKGQHALLAQDLKLLDHNPPYWLLELIIEEGKDAVQKKLAMELLRVRGTPYSPAKAIA